MDFNLVVTRPFGTYGVGDVVTDPDTVTHLLETQAGSVVKIIPPKEG